MKSREGICSHLNSVTAKPNEILDSPLPVRRALDKRSGNNNKVRARSGSIDHGWVYLFCMAG
jgi:hypothetical protein